MSNAIEWPEPVFVEDTRFGIAWGELIYREAWGLAIYVVVNGNSQTYYEGETARQDAERHYYDLVIPLVHGGSGWE